MLAVLTDLLVSSLGLGATRPVISAKVLRDWKVDARKLNERSLTSFSVLSFKQN